MQVLKLVNDTLINFVEACDSRGVARRAGDPSSIASSHEHCHDIVSALYVTNSSRRN